MVTGVIELIDGGEVLAAVHDESALVLDQSRMRLVGQERAIAAPGGTASGDSPYRAEREAERLSRAAEERRPICKRRTTSNDRGRGRSTIARVSRTLASGESEREVQNGMGWSRG